MIDDTKLLSLMNSYILEFDSIKPTFTTKLWPSPIEYIAKYILQVMDGDIKSNNEKQRILCKKCEKYILSPDILYNDPIEMILYHLMFNSMHFAQPMKPYIIGKDKETSGYKPALYHMELRIFRDKKIYQHLHNNIVGNVKQHMITKSNVITVRWPKCMEQYFDEQPYKTKDAITFEEFCEKCNLNDSFNIQCKL